jgi:hypothetical protein
MDCQQVKLMLSAFQDGCVVDSERRSIVAHLDRCGECSLHLGQLEMVRQSLRAAPRRPMPAHLSFALRSLASREATRQRYYAGFRGFVRGLGERAGLFATNLMRPLALPAAGGLASAVFLFSMVMTNFQDIVRDHPNDVRLAAIATDASVRNILFEMSEDSEITLDILVDEQGRVVDYTFPDGAGEIKTAPMRRKLESTLLLTEFTPATTFGRAVSGWVRVKFSGRSEIDVKG